MASDFFLDVSDKGVPDNSLGDEMDFESLLRDQQLDGGLMDLYVEIAGDTMTGPLIITPTTDTTELFQVNQADGTVILDVDSTNNRVGIGFNVPSKQLDIYPVTAGDGIRLRGNEIAYDDTTTSVPGEISGPWIVGDETNPTEIQTSNDSYAEDQTRNENEFLYEFGFNITAETITGIEVKIEAQRGGTPANIDVYVSNNGGSTYSTAKNTGALTASDVVYTLGSSTDLWGLEWTASSFNDVNFKVKCVTRKTLPSNSIYVDHVQVVVYHSAQPYSVHQLADFYINTDGSLVMDLTPGNDTAQFFDLRSEDNEYGLVLRESDGTGTAAFGNFYVTAGTPDYLSINVSGTTDTNALVITSTDLVGVGKIPTTDLDVDGTIQGTNLTATSELVLPASTTPTVDATGELALDTDGDNSTVIQGVLTAYDGSNQVWYFGSEGYPSADNDVLAYDSATNKVTWQAQVGAGGGGDVATDEIWDAKGDLAVGTGADTAQKLTVGTNAYIMVADSTETTGIKWVAAPTTTAKVAAFLTSNQTITTATWTRIQLNSVASPGYDPGSGFDTSTNYNYTIPVTGYYSIKAFMLWQGVDAARFYIGIGVNETASSAPNFYWPVHGSHTNNLGMTIATDLYLTASQTVSLHGYQDSGSDKLVYGNASSIYTRLTVHLLSV